MLPSLSSAALAALPDPVATLNGNTLLGVSPTAPHHTIGGGVVSLAVEAPSWLRPFPLLLLCVSLHDSQLVRGIFMTFDQAMNPILRDCVELHP